MTQVEEIIRQLEQLLFDCTKAMASERVQRSGFWDKYIESVMRSKKPQTFVATCEGLEIILSTILSLPSSEALFSHSPKLPEALLADLEWLLTKAEDQSYEVFPGDPYYGTFDRGLKQPDNSIDALAFFLAVCIHSLECKKRWYIFEKLDQNMLEQAIDESIKTLLVSMEKTKGLGWPDKISSASPDIYSTWSVLETIDELRRFQEDRYHDLEESHFLDSVTQWLQGQIKGTFDKCEQVFDNPPRKEDITSNDAVCRSLACLHEALQVVTSLTILGRGNARQLGRCVASILTQAPNLLHMNLPARYRNNVLDYTLVPLLLRCLSSVFWRYPKGGRSSTDFYSGLGELVQRKDNVLYDCFRTLVSEKRIHRRGRFLALFREPDPGPQPQFPNEFEIYYTERTVESLISYHQYMKEKRVDKKVQSITFYSIPENVSTSIQVPRMSLPPLESLSIYSDELRQRYGDVLHGCVLLCVQHFLSDLPPFIQKLIDSGANGYDIYLLRKTYAYPNGDKVQNYLERKFGCHVEMQPILESGALKVKRKILGEAIAKCKTGDRKRLLIIEDGGYFVPLMHREFRKDCRLCLGGVEQTTRGLKNDKEVNGSNLEFPLLNVAKSKLKSEFEGPEVADTLAGNIKSVCMSSYVNFHPRYTRILVLGYGTIGKQLVSKLLARGFSITVFDKRRKVREDAKEERKCQGYRFEVLDSLSSDTLSEFKFIVGVTGEPSISALDFLGMKNGVILASGSSERYEIDLAKLEKLVKAPASRHIKRDRHPFLTRYELKGDRAIRILCRGEPINFSLSAGIPPIAIELVLMQMLWGAIAIAAGDYRSKLGIKKFPEKEEQQIRRIFEMMQR